MKILITAASGLVGKALVTELQIQGHEVFALVRNPQKVVGLNPNNVYLWDKDTSLTTNAISGKDVVINLAGEGIADKPWTTKRKKQLRSSRLDTTRNLVKSITSIPESHRPKVFISASAIGIYGEDAGKIFDESWPAGKGFLAELCTEWEETTKIEEHYNVRVVNMRLGIILSKNGGFLRKMAPVILGNGNQWISWVHISDVVRFVNEAISNPSFKGPYNLTSPEPIKNSDLTRVYSKKMGFPFVMRTPEKILKLVLGEMASVVIASQRVLANRLLRTGFNFEFNSFQGALDNIYGNDNFLDNYHNADQFIPLPKDKVFHFFSLAENLEQITPPWLNFKITHKSADKIAENILIDYKLKIHGIPVKWRTRISKWQPDELFVDEQLKGPYTKWYHVHSFHDVAGGTLIRDDVTFRVPGSIIGKWLLTPFIRKDVEAIFSYRQKIIGQLHKK